MERVAFRSKVDWWLAVVLVTCAAASVVGVVAVAVAESAFLALGLVPLLLISAGLPLWLLRCTDYTFDEVNLHVRCGPFSWRVPLQEIRTVTPTHDPLSSPALSLDRLRIEFGRMESIMVSPKDKGGFLAELRKRVPAV